MKLSLAFRLMAREARGSAIRVTFFIACLSVGVAAIVAVSGMSSGIDRAIRAEAKPLLAADIAVSSESPLPAPVLESVAALAQGRTDVTVSGLRELATVVSVPGEGGGPGPSALVLLKAFEAGYPLYGDLVVDPPRPAGASLDADGTLVAPELASKLHLSVGSVLRIGGQPFTVRGVIVKEPDKVNVSFSLGPRVMVSLDGLGRTSLEGFGSRVDRRILLRLPERDVEKEAERLRAAVPAASGVRVQTYTDAQPALRDGIRRVARFLGLVALVSLVLGGIGVAQTVRAWLATRLDAIAILRCLGIRPREIVVLYAGETLILGLAGSIAGVALGTALLAAAPRFLAGLLPALSVSMWQPAAAARGIVLGTGVAALFSAPALSSARRVPPLRVLRRDADPLVPGAVARLGVGVAIAGGVFATAYAQAQSLKMATVFVVGMAAAAAVLAGASRLLSAAVVRASKARVRVVVRHGLASLGRPGAGTLPALTALGLGVLVVVAIALVQRGLAERLRADLPKDAPNVFLVDLKGAQWPQVRSILEAHGATSVNSVPIIGARLSSVDGIPAADLAKRAKDDGRRRWIFTREQNLTSLQALPKDNVVVAGKLWSDPRPEISIERDFARDMGAKLGSKVVFDVQGVPVELVVTSLRTVEWKSFGINFFLVVEPGVLDDAPQLRVAAARLPADAEQAVQDALAAATPNVTMLRVREIVEKVAAVLERLGLGIRLLGGFAVAAGVAILAGAIGANAHLRGREVAVLKTLGATRKGVVGIFAIEFALIGLVAGIVGTAAGTVLAWAVLTRVMELEWAWHPVVLAVAPPATALLAIGAGIAASAGALRKRPIEVLRAE
ncbi:MAG TPA: FtsX-like permease family protein [Candidatus Polarisedimenticolaceae bacterium]|nr:FtsX-like permease family protein [Candidatus Polarisedimenticolaceae bacterium]